MTGTLEEDRATAAKNLGCYQRERIIGGETWPGRAAEGATGRKAGAGKGQPRQGRGKEGVKEKRGIRKDGGFTLGRVMVASSRWTSSGEISESASAAATTAAGSLACGSQNGSQLLEPKRGSQTGGCVTTVAARSGSSWAAAGCAGGGSRGGRCAVCGFLPGGQQAEGVVERTGQRPAVTAPRLTIPGRLAPPLLTIR